MKSEIVYVVVKASEEPAAFTFTTLLLPSLFMVYLMMLAVNQTM
jgi:hypothetical protein